MYLPSYVNPFATSISLSTVEKSMRIRVTGSKRVNYLSSYVNVSIFYLISITAVTPAPLRIIVMSGAILSVLLHYKCSITLHYITLHLC